jgi:hypothetical protein
MCGLAVSSNNISYQGFQNNISYPGDAFLVKFNSAGQRLWATYYGSNGGDVGYSCATDKFGNVFMAGVTSENSLPGGVQGNYPNYISFNAHQNFLGGGQDAFLVKFNSAGVRQWGTYYGGLDNDWGQSCATDSSGNVYLAGYTNSGNAISFNGYQNTYSGNTDAFLVKFNGAGVRQWCTYYGGSNIEEILSNSCTVDKFGSVFLTGLTYSTNGISNLGYQQTFGGISDVFLAKFKKSGILEWGTYYGGLGSESRSSCTTDNIGNIYLAGSTNSSDKIAIVGFQNTIAGGPDAFLVKFSQPRISGYVWNDLNRNCVKEQNENVSLNGVRLIIQPGNYVAETRNGFYYLDSLAAGTYTVSIDTSSNNWTSTCPAISLKFSLCRT